MTTNPTTIPTLKIRRTTGETAFEFTLGPRTRAWSLLPLPNRILSHFLDHLGKSLGVQFTLTAADWPGSWAFDHVLCEDLGQLVGHGLAELARRRARATGIAGRGQATVCLDDAMLTVVCSLEGRTRVDWSLPNGVSIDGFVDSWYDGDKTAGAAYGTNLRQFVDGFALGAGATVRLVIEQCGNLHHCYEALFRGLGDAMRAALDLDAGRLPGDSSGFAGDADYAVQDDEAHRD
jgi:imidazoleglycerol phosphate dehydratase HisB